MLIEIDLTEAKRLKLKLNQLVLLRFLIDNIDIKHYQSVIQISDDDVNELIKNKILTESSCISDNLNKTLIIEDEFKESLKQRDFFDEFYELYPTSIIRPDGTKDYLRGDINRCRKIYEKHVSKSKSRHDHIMDALRFELTNRRIHSKMGFMKRMYKWLTSEEWLLYDEFLSDKKVIKNVETVYGTNIE